MNLKVSGQTISPINSGQVWLDAGLGPALNIGPLIDFFFSFVGDQFICTGTLVEPDLVVTSASCTLRMFETGVG